MSFDIRLVRQLGDHRIDFQLKNAAGIVALFGPSGAGKSSILNMTAGLLRPDGGRLEIEGR
jgi:molybdate transport system ATP-binding protein